MAVEWLVPFLVFFSVVTIGAGVLLAYFGRKAIRKRLQDLRSQFQPLTAAPPRRRSLVLLGRVGKVASLGGFSLSLREQLARAGYHGPLASAAYLGGKVLLLLIGLGASAVLVLATDLSLQVKVFVVLTAGAVFYFAPNYLVWLRRQSRTAEVRRHLPDGVDLLEICVSAGMGLDMAWNSVAEEIRGLSTVLADEMALTNLEMHLGAPRADAMRHMAERTGAEELSSLVALLVQSDRFGTKISDTLRTFAQTMREERGLKAQETAEKMAVKLLFPLVLFIFPAVLVVIVGPAAIELYKHLLTT